MTDQLWPPELRVFYENLSLSDRSKGNIAEMRDTVAETRRWKRIAYGLTAVCVLLIMTGMFVYVNSGEKSTAVDHVRLSNAENFDLIAVRVHRDWCGKCRQMGNVFAEIQDDLDGERILFLTFDLTSSETTRQSLAISDGLQISEPLNGVESGNIVLLDPAGRHIETLDGTSGRQYLASRIATKL